jgi:ATP-dependent DNA helicase RecG
VFLEEIETPVSSLRGVGEGAASRLANLDVRTVGDLLGHYPSRYDDRTQKIPLSRFRAGGRAHTVAQILDRKPIGFGAKGGVKLLVTDGSGVEAWLAAFGKRALYLGESRYPIGAIIGVTGSFSYKYGAIQSTDFEAPPVIARRGSLGDYRNAMPPDSAVLPVYPLTAGISQVQMRKFLLQALGYCKGIDGRVPQEILARRGLLSKQDAVLAAHRPATPAQADLARKSLIYEEFFVFQKDLAARIQARKRQLPPEGTAQAGGGSSRLSPTQEKLLGSLPFPLTDDQNRVIAEINADIDRGFEDRAAPAGDTSAGDSAGAAFTMARLLQGDVGSGKTLAAFFAAARVRDWGGQSALLAPTEILARQHADKAAELLAGTGLRLAFLTGNVKAQGRKQVLEALREGEVDLVAGTHALFSADVVYRNLSLAIIDEQHRFGVLQRNAIIRKGMESSSPPSPPHLLMMSATPIPRTLAITLFGDLDMSVIRTMPGGRLPIKTHLAEMGKETKVYDFVRRELEAGRQAYFVYPRIESRDDGGEPLKSAEDMYDYLRTGVFLGFACALIHSRVSEDDQRRILRDFHEGKIQVLAATSVIEVGIDNPRATCMVVEHAERFGLSALHQLRGRVGRGGLQSYCFFVYGDNLTDDGKERMRLLLGTTDGFEIAEADLRIRGPGDIRGIQQSGYLTLGIADPIADRELLEMAREDAGA